MFYLSHVEFANDLHKKLRVESGSFKEYAELLGVNRRSLSAQISAARKGKGMSFPLFRSVYIQIDEHVKEVASTPNHVILMYFDDVEDVEVDNAPLIPFATADGGAVGISTQIVEKLGLTPTTPQNA